MANVTIFAKTKSGIVINLSLKPKQARDESYWVASVGEQAVNAPTFPVHEGKEYLCLNDIQVKKLLGITVKRNTNSLIEVFGGIPSEVKKAFDNANIELLKQEAEIINPTRVKFEWHTSHKYINFSFFEGDVKVPYVLAKYSEVCKRFINSISHVEKNTLETFMTGSDYGDYSSWYYYEMAAGDMANIIETGQKNKEDKISAEAKKEADAKAARQAKFEEAKVTGKRVLLSQYFMSGNDIPRRHRDEDSDMGHLCTWANPDGTTSESFSHAY